ncbi:hypothetical protein [Nocardioides sp.]|uniref:hypothetical protein n=1 Tax=Nocardioides sp. TaxID=35761 RepID=UPI002EDB855A
MIVRLQDAYPELVQAQEIQARRELEQREARRRVRRARAAALLGRGYPRAEEVR